MEQREAAGTRTEQRSSGVGGGVGGGVSGDGMDLNGGPPVTQIRGRTSRNPYGVCVCARVNHLVDQGPGKHFPRVPFS